MSEVPTVIRVGIADMNLVTSPDIIRTCGLGSCVGVVIYDSVKKHAGLVHVMLPDSSLSRAGQLNVAKFADTAIVEMVKRLQEKGSRISSLKAKIAGGAQMFQFSTGDLMRIGPRNVEAVKGQLLALGIPILAEDTGGNSGRTIDFNPVTCFLTIKTVNKRTKDI
ncbi:chemotaxis protein CheD [Peribacillus sp. FSL H8-0477]|uniref:chemotaxis protein CheD n=1 Tax=Peribacillus sp. FSL H8-0477 TaxID=2921388 RepID=UPI0030F7ABF2